MSLDINTLFLVTIYVEAMLGLLLLFAWVQNSGIMAVAWWGSAHLLRAASVVLFGMYGSVSDLISIDLANGSALRAFSLATEAVSGRATHQIVGGPSGLPEDVYRRLRYPTEQKRADQRTSRKGRRGTRGGR